MTTTDRCHSRPVAVVTGCSSGIGQATAVTLGRRGHTVVATVRDLDRAGPLLAEAAAAGVPIDLLPLDVSDDRSVALGIDQVLAKHGRIDLLVNNAGVGVTGTLEELSMDHLRQSIDINLLGVARATKAVLPTMRRAGRGPVIAVSSTAGAFGHPFNDAYCAAKFALEGLFESLAPVASSFGVHVSLVEPGPVSGRFVEHSRGMLSRPADDPFATLWQRFSQVAAEGFARAQSPQEVADVIADAATDPQPKLRYQTARWVQRAIGVKVADPTGDRVMAMTGAWLR